MTATPVILVEVMEALEEDILVFFLNRTVNAIIKTGEIDAIVRQSTRIFSVLVMAERLTTQESTLEQRRH